MARLLKRGNKFYVRVYVNGKAKDIAETSKPLLTSGNTLLAADTPNSACALIGSSN